MGIITYTRLAKTEDLSTIIPESNRLKKLRLESLQNDPESFLSRFADEVNQPQDFWLDRHRDRAAQHWVAINTDGVEVEWVAFLVVVDQIHMDEEADERRNLVIGQFLMGAVYVDPSFRRKDVCTDLIRLAIDWIAEDTYVKGRSTSYLNLNVRDDNQAARKLYARLGFEDVGQETTTTKIETDKQHIVINMRLQVLPRGKKTETYAKVFG